MMRPVWARDKNNKLKLIPWEFMERFEDGRWGISFFRLALLEEEERFRFFQFKDAFIRDIAKKIKHPFSEGADVDIIYKRYYLRDYRDK